MLKQRNYQPIKILSAPELGISGLALLGHAHFQKTHNILESHSHSGMEFIVMLKGTQQYVVGDCSYTLHGGDIFMTTPGEIHSGGNAPQNVAEIIWFQLEFTEPNHFLGTVSPNSEYLFTQLRNYNQRIRRVSQKELQVLSSSFRLLDSDSLPSRLLGHNYLIAFLLKNLCSQNEPTEDDSHSNLHLSTAKDYIKEHLYDNPTIEELAAYCGFSPSKFNTRFKELVGSTPHTYMLNLKIEKAKELLNTSDKSITEIAHKLCFSSSEYFSSVFKKYTGMTPTNYRSKD